MAEVGIISFHVLEQPSSPNGWVTHEIMIMKLNKIAVIPVATWNYTMIDCKINSLLKRVILEPKTGIITTITVNRLSVRSKMLRNPCIMRFLFLVLIL
jgi:hypothetical protein